MAAAADFTQSKQAMSYALCKHLNLDPNSISSTLIKENDIVSLFSHIVTSPQDEVKKWVDFSSNFAVSDGEQHAVLGNLNQHLSQMSVLLGGFKPSAADIIVFATVHVFMCHLSDSELQKYPNILRWMDYIQNVVDFGMTLQKINLTKSIFNPPAPAPSHPKKADKGDGDPNSKKAVSGQKNADKSDGAADSKKAAGENKVPGDKANPTSAKNNKPSGDKKKAQEKTAGKTTEAAAEKAPQKSAEKDSECSVSILNIQVGVIRKAWKHPSADSLLVEEIDLGDGNVRQVVSGLAKFFSPDELVNRHVVLITNVKPGKLRDVMSAGLGIPADIFFPTVPNFTKPSEILTVESSASTSPSDPLRYAAHITLKGEPSTHCLVQFASPQIWRVRYNPKYTAVSDYDDFNSRTIVEDKFSSLVDDLQQEYRDSEAWNSYPAKEGWFWKTSFEQKAPDHWVLTTVEYETSESTGVPNTALHFFASPFRIVATRKLKPLDADPAFLKTVGIDTVSEYEEIIWQTTEETFSYQGNPSIGAVNNVVLNIKKPGPAAYLGFGEQGGRTVIKKPTYLNFFCYDNFNYSKVYGLGALDTREPLYHSTPFFLEMNGTPDRKNVTGVMVDNYSQVAIDLGKNDSHTISIATRFNTFDAWILTADDVPRMIWQYTSIVGRPKLKPRFILGHHQACYGYSNEGTVNNVVQRYRDSDIPLDGMHLDVDFQDKYRTFTSSNYGFPNLGSFLNGLKAKGVKSCTNITPILTIRPSDQGPYTALDSFWDVNDKKNPETNLLVADKRYLDGLPNNQPLCWRYDGGLQNLDPNNVDQREKFADYIGAPVYRDDYNFSENYNSGYPFHGGVSYGTNLGTPGFYPDLNRKAARKKWGEQYQYLFDNGLEFVWQDMTTPAAAKCYGDSLGFPSRLLMTDDSYTNPPKTKTAIELWSLYSYNLHKATYHGLNNLKGRENKRNFIIGRGSQTGMHRYAGLWTGDNGSSWDFFRISVAQVLALGYSGLSIAGVDMGGFTADPANTLPNPRWCDPELLIRWYAGAFLLPWYRNHYLQHPEASSGGCKAFQEPWAYDDILHNFPGPLPPDQAALYRSVVPVCRYYVQLRYSLLQVLYDYMFANLINGLPVARAMLVTDPFDTSLFNSNQGFIDNQYLLGHNILVCPQVEEKAGRRDVYLPNSDKWYPSNLRVNNQGFGPDPILKHAAVLQKPAPGGKIVDYDCHIPDAVAHPEQVAYVTPVYIRGGAIIPQLDVRQWVKEGDLNPPTIHVYPGGKPKEATSYSMYLDDGVSRDSAPIDLPQHKYKDASLYAKAKGFYREVKITQENTGTNRKITIRHQWDGYDPKATVGDAYNFAIWTVQATAPLESQISVDFEDENGMTVIDSGLTSTYIAGRGVLTVSVPVHLVPSLKTPQNYTQGSFADRYLAVNVTGLP